MNFRSRNQPFVVGTVVLLLFVGVLLPLTAGTGSSDENWSMSRHDAERTGATNSAVPLTLPVELWNFTLNDDGSNYAPPAVVVADGLVYVGSNDLYCFKASTGAKLWSFPLSNECDFTPAVVEGHVYVGSVEGYVYCLDSTSGAQVWNSSVDGSVASPVTYSDGRVYVETWGGTVVCLDEENGAKVWDYSTDAQAYGLSVAVSGGYVYVCAGDELLCLDAANGAKMWAFTAGGKLSSPSLAASYVYVGSADGNAYCIRASDGAKMWNYTAEYNNAGPSHNYHWGNRVSDIAIADNYVYFGSSNFQAYCLDSVDGSKVWNYTTNAGVYLAPSVGSETVLVGSYDGNLYCLNSTDASELWSHPVGVYSPVSAAGSAGSAAIADNTIYVVGNGVLYALSEPKTGDSGFPLTYVIVALVVVVCVVLAVAVLLRRR